MIANSDYVVVMVIVIVVIRLNLVYRDDVIILLVSGVRVGGAVEQVVIHVHTDLRCDSIYIRSSIYMHIKGANLF